MKRIFFSVLFLLFLAGSAYALSITDSASLASTDYISHGWGTRTDLEGMGDWLRWKHEYDFNPDTMSITSASLTIGLFDNDTDTNWNPLSFEIGLGVTEGGMWGVGEVDTGDYSFNLGLNGLDDGLYYVTLASLWGDFSITSSLLAINYESDPIISATPVPEPASMLLFGTGLIGLAGACRKRSSKI